ncbi:MAG: GNAT family N-acetyltransferase [Synergistaceae bacterium]|nr:GNAT family N-acetyltransferase [Synergistaceae bacterium]
MNRAVMSNLRTLIGISGSLGGSRALADSRGLWACDCGFGSAYENYALLVPDAAVETEGLVSSGLDFFADARSPHIWPLFPGTPERAKAMLEGRGARHDDTFYGMTARLPDGLKTTRDVDARGLWIQGPECAGDWADAAWHGFDSGEPAPEGFVRFVSQIALREGISLFGIRDRESGRIAATGLLNAADGYAGVYYVSTRPEFRRTGLGVLVMRALMEKGSELGCRRACLLATPAGRPLYLKCGFEDSCRVAIMIHDAFATGERRAIR